MNQNKKPNLLLADGSVFSRFHWLETMGQLVVKNLLQYRNDRYQEIYTDPILILDR